jgi:DNA ligase (NAD+)
MDIENKFKQLERFDAAYEQGNPLIPDEQYDLLKRELEELSPNHEYFKTVGASVRGEKVDLPYPMGSLNQIYEGDIHKWITKYNLSDEDIIITDKLDGVSVLLIYEKHPDRQGVCIFKSAYSRGDGIKGEDMTRHVSKIPSVPKELGGEYAAIRAEVIMPNATFNAKYKNKYKNARNMVAGVLNRKEPTPEQLSDIDVVAYEVIDAATEKDTKNDTLLWLGVNGFKTPVMVTEAGSSLNDAVLANRLKLAKENSPYELDGIVLTVKDYSKFKNVSKSSSLNPEHSVKFKVLDEDSIVETEVVDVLWKISKTGFYKPRVQIKPVELLGSTITYATGFNAKFINESGIGIGSKIRITKAGSVIPYIVETTKKVDPKMPDGEWHWDENHVEAVIDNSPQQIFMEVVHFFKTIEMDNAQETSLEKVIKNQGLESEDFSTIVFEIVSMMGAEWKRIIGENGIKAHDSLHKKLSTMKPEKLLGATPFFGRGFGVRKAKKILDQMNYEDFLEASMDDIQNLEGFNTTAEAVFDGINEYKDFFEKIEFAVEFEEHEESEQTLEGEKIVMTGFRDKQLQEAIENRGGKVTTSVSKNTTMVIAQDVNSTSSKVKKAKELNIPVISQRDFNFRYIQ